MKQTKRAIRRPLALGIAGCVAVACAAIAAVTFSTGANAQLSDKDTAAISQTIGAWWSAVDRVLPEKDSSSADVPKTDAAAAQASYEAGLKAVGTDEFISSAAGQLDMQSSFEADAGIGDFVKRLDTQVLSVDYVRTLDNGDIVVRAKLWNGQVADHYDSGTIGKGAAVTTYVDETPTYQYTMRQVAGAWKIVDEMLAFVSEDASAKEYGPLTPHSTSDQDLTSFSSGEPDSN